MIAETRRLLQTGEKAVLVVGPTGMGKTHLAAFVLGEAARKGLRSLFVAHRIEIVRQSSDAFVKQNINHSIICAGFHNDPWPKVQIASIQTLARRLDRVSKPDLIVFDEAHHVAAGSWQKIIEWVPEAYRIGLTATPERLDGKGLKPWFSKMVMGPPVRQLITDGYLSPYRLVAPPPQYDLRGIGTVAGDYEKGQLAARMDTPTITGCAVTEYKNRVNGKRAIVRACSIQHSLHIADQFRAAGVPAEHVDGNSTPEYRKAAMDRFVKGETLILTNVGLYSEGVDIPAVECVIDMRPTQSKTLALQFWGRALRICEGKKEAWIIDHANNWERHGLPCDERRWDLDGRKKRKASSESGGPSVRLCGACFAACKAGVMVCPYCGYQFETKPRDVETKEGDLKEVDLLAARRARGLEESRCETLEDFQALGKERGYANGWAFMRMRGRKMARRAKEVVGR